jgi:hypothetical protein
MTAFQIHSSQIRKTITFKRVPKRLTYLGINLTKDMANLYNENYKSLKKEINEDIRIWKDSPCSWISRNNIVKNDFSTKNNLYVQCHPYRNSNGLLH